MAKILYMQEFSPPVRSVLLTAETLGIKLEHRIVDLSKGDHLTEAYRKLNPQHTIPTLEDNGTIIWDSHAINAYLVGQYGEDDSLYPKDLLKRAIVDQRLHFDSGVIFAWLKYIARGVKYKGRTALTDDQIEHIEAGYIHLESFLKGNLWVTGDTITIADFSLLTNVSTFNAIYPVEEKKFPNISRWLKQADAVPYYRKVNQKGLEEFQEMMAPLLTNLNKH